MTLRTLHLQLRFLLPLTITLVVAAYLAVPLMDQVTLRWFSRDLNSRGALVANTLSDSVVQALVTDRPAQLRGLFERSVQDERLFAIGLCGDGDRLVQRSDSFPPTLSCSGAEILSREAEPRLALAGGAVHVGVHDVMGQRPPPPAAVVETTPPMYPEDPLPAPVAASPAFTQPVRLGRLVLLQDMSFIERRSQDTRRYLIGLMTGLGLVIALITMVVAQLSWATTTVMKAITSPRTVIRPMR